MQRATQADKPIQTRSNAIQEVKNVAAGDVARWSSEIIDPCKKRNAITFMVQCPSIIIDRESF